MDVKEFLTNGLFLPGEFRDFHDQKDLFKSIDYWARETENEINWQDAHVYTIDIFLKFMAAHGYTLQRCKRKVNFCNIYDTVKEYERMVDKMGILRKPEEDKNET